MGWDIKKSQTNNSNNTIEFKSLNDAKEDRGLKILSYGDFSTGKTHFGLTANNPVYIIDTENGSSPLANKFPNAKVVVISEIPLEDSIINKYKNKEEYHEILNYIRFKKVVDMLVAIPDNEIGTIIVDSMTDVWKYVQAYVKDEVFKLTVLQKVAQQFDWGTINGEHDRTLMKLINKKCNLILTARQSEIYSGPGQPTGQYQPACNKKLPYFVDIVLHHTCKFMSGKFVFNAKITKLRQKGDVIGQTITNPSFDKLKQLIEK